MFRNLMLYKKISLDFAYYIINGKVKYKMTVMAMDENDDRYADFPNWTVSTNV